MYIFNGSSNNVIKDFKNFKDNIFVYLDAHWEDFVPLDDEQMPKKIWWNNCIDDFKVEQIQSEIHKYSDVDESWSFRYSKFGCFHSYRPSEIIQVYFCFKGNKAKKILEIEEITYENVNNEKIIT